MLNRRRFVQKLCIAGICSCGFSNALGSVVNENSIAATPDIKSRWLFLLLKEAGKMQDQEMVRKMIKAACVSHYDQLEMDKLLLPYIGDVKRFIEFLTKEWGWIVDYQEKTGRIIANENKDFCVCPVLSARNDKKTQAMCYCSEGFAELMFSKVIRNNVEAEIIASIHRGNANCIYQIQIS